MRTEVCNWEKKLQEVFDDNTLLLATTYQSRSCPRERELCGFVHDHFIITGDSVQLTWLESRLKKRLNFGRCADLGVDDGVDKMVTILNRLGAIVKSCLHGRVWTDSTSALSYAMGATCRQAQQGI